MLDNSLTKNLPNEVTHAKTRENPRNRRPYKVKGKRHSRKLSGVVKRSPKFTEETESLKTYVYDLGYSQVDIYTDTTHKIAEYCDQVYKNGVDVKRSIEELHVLLLDILDDLD